MRAINGSLWTQFIGLADFVLVPFYLIILYAIAYRVRNKNYPMGHPWRPYFMPGFSVKIFGSIFIGLVYQYYYSGGDTSAFFYHANVINSSASESVLKWVRLLLGLPGRFNGDYSPYISQMMWYRGGSYVVSAFTAITNVFTFNTYLPSSVITGAISFTGAWALFRTFAIQYPKYIRSVAIATLFIPSTFVWGSGIFKDTWCLFGLGWMTYATFQLLIQRNITLRNILIIIGTFYLILIIKIYILIAFLPALILWIFFVYSSRIKNVFFKIIISVLIISSTGAGLYYISIAYSKELGEYSLESLAETSATTRSYIHTISLRSDASAYDLGKIDASVTGMIRKFPLAVNVSLFRPYLWEAKKPMVVMNALEATLFLFFTIKLFLTVGPLKIWKSIRRNANIQFCLIFTLIFAFAVGISSYNFGALSRYRIPCLPFFALSLALIYYDNKPEDRRFFSLNFR